MTLEVAAAKAGMDVKTARKYLRDARLPSETKERHEWRTRPDSFADVRDEVRDMAAHSYPSPVFADLYRAHNGTHIAEIYYFLHGTGTFAIGGTLENPQEDAADAWSTKMVRGPSVSGTFKGQTEVKFALGDMIIAPTGLPHRPSAITSVPRDIIRFAIDPDKVLPIK